MIKQTITYMDFNGVEHTEDFHFHLSLPEVTRLEAELGDTIESYTKKLVERKDANEMLSFFEKLILNAYGVKTENGKSFRKNAELREEFEYSQAYAEIFEKMIIDQDFARTFGAGIADNGKAKKNVVAPKLVE